MKYHGPGQVCRIMYLFICTDINIYLSHMVVTDEACISCYISCNNICNLCRMNLLVRDVIDYNFNFPFVKAQKLNLSTCQSSVDI